MGLMDFEAPGSRDSEIVLMYIDESRLRSNEESREPYPDNSERTIKRRKRCTMKSMKS